MLKTLNLNYVKAVFTEISILKEYKEKMIFSIPQYSNMVISQAMLIKILSINTSHNIFFIYEYIIQLLCILSELEPI